MKTHNTVIIYPPTIDWHWMKQRPQHLMEQFSLHGFEVYYCDKTQSTRSYSIINPNLTVIHNNQYLVSEVIPRLRSQGKIIVLWVSWSKLHSILDMYSADYIVYDYLDDFSAWRPYHRPMVNRAHLVITTSAILQSQMQAEFPEKTSVLVPNGCDISHFKPNASRKRPSEFLNHHGPIITYTGAWATWIDQELVNKIAMTLKHAMVAVIGTEFGSAVNRSIPNLRYLGYKPYQELPSYLQHSTLCIIPFLLGQVTNATNPVKMYEYLASGKPVVSTDIPEARNIPSVHIGPNHAAFIEKIRLILEKQVLFNELEVNSWLASHTWEKRFEAISTLLSERGLT